MSEEGRVARHAGVVGAATLLSRVLGLIREQVMATLFGAGFASDAFNVAFRIPNLLRDLFAEGAMSSAFVPTFTEARKREGDASAWALARQLMMTLLLVLGALVVVGWVAAPLLVRLYAPGFDAVPGKTDLTVLLTRVMLPFLPAVALAAAAMGMLNARGRFAVPALAPAWLNVGMIVGGLALIPVFRAMGQPPILAMAVGVLIGAFAQFACQIPSLAAEGFRFAWEVPRRHPGVARVAALMGPATVGLAATQLNLFVSTWIASLLQQGSVSWLWYAFRLMQLPIGVFGVALATVSLPALSRAAVERDHTALRTTLSATLRLVLLLTVPAAVWLAAMAAPVIALLYEHGRFSVRDTAQTAFALQAYCLGLPAFAAVGVLTRAFYALGDTRTPVRASFVSVALAIALNLLFIGPWRVLGLEHAGLALSTSLTSIVNAAQLAVALHRRLGRLDGRRMLATFTRVTIAAVLAGALCLLLSRALQGLPRVWTLELAVVAGGMLVAAGVAYFVMKLLRVQELAALEDLIRALLRRLTGARDRPPA
ncbi:MAG TPA: murein biosynthesis integral membrane protein MurJ [Candidatus Eisenbacteria bacterium]|nr:murein biosynthesis integral membrane protein MurJ [Candidatus Eisenbacteria bacterium]